MIVASEMTESIANILADPRKTSLAVAASEALLAQAMAAQERGDVVRFYPVVYLDDMRIIERIELVFPNGDAERLKETQS